MKQFLKYLECVLITFFTIISFLFFIGGTAHLTVKIIETFGYDVLLLLIIIIISFVVGTAIYVSGGGD